MAARGSARRSPSITIGVALDFQRTHPDTLAQTA
jgi:hypothetical protein